MWNSKTYIILFQKERKTVLTIKLQESGGVYRICHVALMYSYFLHNYSTFHKALDRQSLL